MEFGNCDVLGVACNVNISTSCFFAVAFGDDVIGKVGLDDAGTGENREARLAVVGFCGIF